MKILIPDVAIILPAFNEGITIAQTIEAFHGELPSARIVVVNNNSSDATAEISRDTLKRLAARGEVIDEKRQGKGNAMRRAFMDVDADIYVMADADLTYPAERVHDLIRIIAQNHADMVVGDRHSSGHYKAENKRRFHNFGNNAVKWLINKLFRSNLVDIMSGYRAFSRKFAKNYPILVEGFQIETDMTLHALDKRFRICEIPIEYKDRPVGSVSKLNTFSDGARVIFAIAQILRYYRPLTFFGGLSIVFGLLGLVTAFPVFQDWVRYRYIYHVPLAILAAAIEIVAVLSLSAGIILDTITHQHRLNFERHLLDR
jgi:glycosyltransferase involved in cell wall biosynthesis